MDMRSVGKAIGLLTASLSLGAAMPSARYAEGQIWEYHTRPQDAGSLLKIQKIEMLADEKIYHISVIGVHLKKPGMDTVLPHLPVSHETLDESVVRLSTQHPDFPTTAVNEGIAAWRNARGGVFTIAMADILNFVDESLK